ncbi:MaoC family dehydratase [Spongisporangium articulatum]|uniref:MaoC family dehydratase n=1 Tax=Spongisporangium articulatum TaxID=3362603 RepID=A0ABW8ALL3_9ACTN
MVRVVEGIVGLLELVGESLGPSSWVEVTQEMVDAFAAATGDHQWIHVDVERAQAGPFGGPIAHGYLTLSLIPRFLPELIEARGFSMGVNYGCERVRFPTPVPVGRRVRAGMVVDEVTEVAGGAQFRATITIELEEAAKPACVAVVLLRRYL